MPDLMSPFETYRRPRDRADTTGTAFDDRPWLGRQLGIGSSTQDLTPQPRNSLMDPNEEAGAHWRYTPGSPWEASKGAQRAEAILGAPGVNELLLASNFLAPRPGAAMLPTPAPKPQGIRAYHGSPHDFEKFSLDKIGSGEGAQAFGHGLYFSENEAVAKSYRDALGPRNAPPGQNVALGWLKWHDGDAARAAGALKAEIARTGLPGGSELKQALALIENGTATSKPGHMYEVNINAKPEHFLDWDRPLSQQSPQVRAAVPKDWHDGAHGTSADYPPWKGHAQRPDGMQALREAGIPGIRYKDLGSRAADGGTHNYVVFDDKRIEILRKYGLGGLMAGGAATQAPGLLAPSAQSPNN